jgi:hypothetical protein
MEQSKICIGVFLLRAAAPSSNYECGYVLMRTVGSQVRLGKIQQISNPE